MKDWKTLQPDKIKLLTKHFTPGRGGQKIDKVVIHHTAGVLTTEQVWDVWQTRQASAHYIVETSGKIGQMVWDRDTAWHAANLHVNQTAIGIEHSNSSGGGADWPINDVTLEEGAHLVAAICHYYKLGRPQVGKNVRFHREFAGTSCPHHLAPGGKYHDNYIARARFWYDEMGNPSSTVTSSSSVKVDDGGNIVNEIVGRVNDLWTQLRGPSGEGWSQLGKNSEGKNLTLVDGVAALRHDVARLTDLVAELIVELRGKK